MNRANPIVVAEIVKSVPHTETMIAVALLHDVVEDTGVQRGILAEVFGRRFVIKLYAASELANGS